MNDAPEDDVDAAMPLGMAGRPRSFIHRKILRRHATHLGDIFRIASSLFANAEQQRVAPIRTTFLDNVPSGGRCFVSRAHDGTIVITLEDGRGERIVLNASDLTEIQNAASRLKQELERNETGPDTAQ